jgi:hypothetical protein
MAQHRDSFPCLVLFFGSGATAHPTSVYLARVPMRASRASQVKAKSVAQNGTRILSIAIPFLPKSANSVTFVSVVTFSILANSFELAGNALTMDFAHIRRDAKITSSHGRCQ